MFIYVAGPLTLGDQTVNVRRAIDAGEQLAAMGHIPFIPHLTMFWHLIHPHDWAFWIAQDIAWLEKCDGLLRLPGDSRGADLEVEHAAFGGIPIYYNLNDVPGIKTAIRTAVLP